MHDGSTEGPGAERSAGEPRPAKRRRQGGRGAGPGGGRPRKLRPIATLVRADIRKLSGYLRLAYQGGPEFRQRIAEGLNSLPTLIHAAVHAAGGHVATCNLLLTYAPHLAGQTARGLDAVRFAEISGIYLPDERVALIAEFIEPMRQAVPAGHVAATVREEVAHALDHARRRCISQQSRIPGGLPGGAEDGQTAIAAPGSHG